MSDPREHPQQRGTEDLHAQYAETSDLPQGPPVIPPSRPSSPSSIDEDAAGTPAENRPVEAPPGAQGKRRRWPWVVLAVIVGLAVLLVAGELIARSVVTSKVRQAIDSLDGLTFKELNVSVPDSPMLGSLIGGKLETVRATAKQADIDVDRLASSAGTDTELDVAPLHLTDVALVAEGVPVRQSSDPAANTVGKARLDGTLATASVAELAAAAGVPGKLTVDTQGVTTEISVLGMPVKARVGVKAGTDCQSIAWTMESVDLGSAKVPEGLLKTLGLGGRDFAIEVPSMPSGICLSEVNVQDSGLRVTLTGEKIGVDSLEGGGTDTGTGTGGGQSGR